MVAEAMNDARATAERRARRAYELGMLRLGAMRGALVAGAVALLGAAGLTERPSIAWVAVVFGAWLVLGWRGALVWRGALGGLAAGAVALVAPLSLVRPCCAAMTSATRCSMPELCVAAGAVLGAIAAATLPRVTTRGQWARASAGALLGVGSLVACRCAEMLVGEAVGLAGGLLASAAGLAAARAWWAQRA